MGENHRSSNSYGSRFLILLSPLEAPSSLSYILVEPFHVVQNVNDELDFIVDGLDEGVPYAKRILHTRPANFK